VVLANGVIVNANPKSHSDLYWALRGGGNNFGIVTRFDLMTFSQGDLWGGQNIHFGNQNATLIKALTNLNSATPADPYAALILAFAYVRQLDIYLAVVDREYGKPVVNPPVFDDFKDLPSISSTMRITNLTDLTNEFNSSNPGGFR
jgi:FAD/FMN-containing dehydrogenase